VASHLAHQRHRRVACRIAARMLLAGRQTHACKKAGLGQASWLPQRSYIPWLIPHMVMQIRAASCCPNHVVTAAHPAADPVCNTLGVDQASHEMSTAQLLAKQVLYPLASKLRTDNASGLIAMPHAHMPRSMNSRSHCCSHRWSASSPACDHSVLPEPMLARLPRLLQHAAGRWMLLMHA
jgi:hypothetical protein